MSHKDFLLLTCNMFVVGGWIMLEVPWWGFIGWGAMLLISSFAQSK